jgi:hypothetical protein
MCPLTETATRFGGCRLGYAVHDVAIAVAFYNRLAKRFEHQNNVWTIAMMRKLGMVLPRFRQMT